MRRIMSAMLLALLSLATNANAQGGFSNASLNGIYVFELSGHNSATVGIPGLALVNQPPGSFTVVAQNFPILTPFGVVGTIVFDGLGNVTGGSGTCLGVGLTESIADDSTSPPTQAFTTFSQRGAITSISGTYTVNSDGTGPMTLNTSGDPQCTVTGVQINLIVAGGGNSGVMWNAVNTGPPQDFGNGFVGTFAKQ